MVIVRQYYIKLLIYVCAVYDDLIYPHMALYGTYFYQAFDADVNRLSIIRPVS